MRPLQGNPFMKLQTLDIENAVGGVLIHNIADAQGHKALHKGHRLTSGDVEKLHALGKEQVFVGTFDPGDVSENDAAVRIANAVAGQNLAQSAVSTGRINLMSNVRGVFDVNLDAQMEINLLDGITLATIPAYSVVEPKKIVATVKTIGLAIPEASLERVEEITRAANEIVGVRELPSARVAVILTGSAKVRAGVEKSLMPPIRGRIEDLGGQVVSNEYVDHAEDAIAEAIRRARAKNVDCIILAGETSIMDASDVTPRGIRQADGEIEIWGVPVEPGNLFLLAYAANLPIIGAPGCVKSRDLNIVDLVLPILSR
jgi:molybdenum cofactor cytidylyltransferase